MLPVTLTAIASLVMVTAGCGADDINHPTPQEEHLTQIRLELEMRVENGLAAELPPPMPPEQVDIAEVVLHRRQLADQMAGTVQASMVPLTVAASLFAIDGAADLLLSIVPVDHLGRAVEVAKDAFKIRKGNKRAKKLIALQKQFEALLSANEREFLRLAGALKASERRALKVIHARAGSSNLIQSLMRKHLDRDADILWIAQKLEQGKFERAFARRYTFDKDIIEEITDYDANIPWSTLQAVVQRKRVPQSDRDALARKMAGLMGERVAREAVDSPAFARKYLRPGDIHQWKTARGSNSMPSP